MSNEKTTNPNEPAPVDAIGGATPATGGKRKPPAMPRPGQLVVSLPQAAAMLGISQSEARRWERMGLMPPLVKLPTRGTGRARRLYFRTADIEAMIDRSTAGAGAGGR